MNHISARITDRALKALEEYSAEHKCSRSSAITAILERLEKSAVQKVNTPEHTLNTGTSKQMNTSENARFDALEARVKELESGVSKATAKDIAEQCKAATLKRQQEYQAKQAQVQNDTDSMNQTNANEVVENAIMESVSSEDAKWIELIRDTNGAFTDIDAYRVEQGFSKHEYQAFCEFLTRNEDKAISLLKVGKKAIKFRLVINNEPKE